MNKPIIIINEIERYSIKAETNSDFFINFEEKSKILSLDIILIIPNKARRKNIPNEIAITDDNPI